MTRRLRQWEARPALAPRLHLPQISQTHPTRQPVLHIASVGELDAVIGRFCDGWNQRCQPFTWTKDADQIFATFKGPTALQAADG